MLIIVNKLKSLIHSLKQIQPAATTTTTTPATDDNITSSQSVAAYHDEDQGAAAAAAPVSRETSHPPGVAVPVHVASTAASLEVLLNTAFGSIKITLSVFKTLQSYE